jgi:tetratricopeptide (TPR) repeat protein
MRSAKCEVKRRKQMKRIITTVMAGIIAASMTGCATLRPQDPASVAMAIAGLDAFKPKTEPEKQDNHVYAKALVKLGDAEYARKNYKSALGHYDNALRDWDNYMVYTKIAYCLRNLGNIADAKMVYKKALKMTPAVKTKGGDAR